MLVIYCLEEDIMNGKLRFYAHALLVACLMLACTVVFGVQDTRAETYKPIELNAAWNLHVDGEDMGSDWYSLKYDATALEMGHAGTKWNVGQTGADVISFHYYVS